jgi:hypothetical protein
MTMGGLVHSLRRLFGAPSRRHVLPGYVSIGQGSYGLDRNSFAGLSPDCPVHIGNYCSFGPEVLVFCRTDHRTDLPSTYPFRSTQYGATANTDAITRGPITIGHDVWVGARTMILSGVTIGNGAIIGAGAVVTKDIPPFSVSMGVPAKMHRLRFEADQIAALGEIAWWDWPPALIEAHMDLFYTDVDAFIAQAQKVTP